MTTPRLYYFSGSPFARAMRVLAMAGAPEHAYAADIDPKLRPGITLSGVLFACLMLWAEDRAGLDWRALTSAAPLVDDLAKRNSFAATVPAPWE